MTKTCCIPCCRNSSNSLPKHHLFSVPNKNFCSKSKKKWAEDLERIILCLRSDHVHIKSLLHKNRASICEEHFEEKCIIAKGTRKELACGSIPTLKLPKRMVSTTLKKRRSPKKRSNEKIYAKTLGDVKKQLKRGLPNTWQYIDNDNDVVLHLKSSTDQFQYQVCISSSLKISLVYYGWAVAHGAKLDALQHSLTKCPIDDILEQIEGFCVCKGCDNESIHQLIPHVITKSAKPFSEGENAIPTSTILAYRSKGCTILTANAGVQTCLHCKKVQSAHDKLTREKRRYCETVSDQPVKRLCVERTLPSRLKATLSMRENRIAELEAEISRLLEDKTKQIEIGKELAGDTEDIFDAASKDGKIDTFNEIMWKEQIKLNKLKPYGERYHPEVIRFCPSLASKSQAAYNELRESGILRLSSSRTLYSYGNVYRTTPGLVSGVPKEIEKEGLNMDKHQL